MTRTLPPIDLTCSSLEVGNVHLTRACWNGLSVSLLGSRNAPHHGVHSQAPNNTSRVHTVGGQEIQARASIEKRISDAFVVQAMSEPGTEARWKADRALDRLEAHWAAVQAQIDALDMSRGSRGGIAHTFLVTVPSLTVRVIGEESETGTYISDLWTGHVTVDLSTPRLKEYQHTDPDLLKGAWPLYAVRGDKTGLKPAKGSADWHRELLQALWPDPGLRLRLIPVEQQDGGIGATENGSSPASEPATVI